VSAPYRLTRAERQRRAAAALIRCMDAMDETGAAAVITRAAADVSGEQNVDAVLRWVWRMEAERVMQRRYGGELARLYRTRVLLADLIGVLAAALNDETAETTGGRHAA